MNEPSNDAPPTITESPLDTVPEAERQRILTLGEKAWDVAYQSIPAADLVARREAANEAKRAAIAREVAAYHRQRDNSEFYALATAAIAATAIPAIVNAWEDARAHVAAGEDDKARTRLRYAQSITADGHRESAGIRWLTGTPIGEAAAGEARAYRVPAKHSGSHGCDVCGHGTMEGTFDPTEPCPECGTVYGLDFRRLIAKALAQPGAPTHRGVAYAAADRWGAKPKSAEEALSGWLNGSRPQLSPHAIEAILDALGARIVFDAA